MTVESVTLDYCKHGWMPDTICRAVCEIKQVEMVEKKVFDAVVRDKAVEIVDRLHRFTYEYSSDPAGHLQEYDVAEELVLAEANLAIKQSALDELKLSEEHNFELRRAAEQRVKDLERSLRTADEIVEAAREWQRALIRANEILTDYKLTPPGKLAALNEVLPSMPQNVRVDAST